MGKLTNIWEGLLGSISVDGVSDSVKETFGEHETILQGIEEEIISEDNEKKI